MKRKIKDFLNKRVITSTLSIAILCNTIAPISVYAADESTDVVSSLYIEKDGHKYQLFDFPLYWKEAEAYCESLGGHLVTVVDEEEKAFVEQFAREKGKKRIYWYGATDEVKEGDWQWVTGEDPSIIRKYGVFDNMSRVENYLALTGLPNAYWNDWNNSGNDGHPIGMYSYDNLGFICEWDNISVTEPSYVSSPYVLFSGSDSNDLILNCWKSSFAGDVYSGRKFISNASELYLSGKVNAVDTVSAYGWKVEIEERNEQVDKEDMPDWDQRIITTAGESENYDQDIVKYDDRNAVNGAIKTTGSVVINGTTFDGDCYIIADGDITYNVNDFISSGRVVLYSRNGNITVNGTNIDLNGIMYAPNGTVAFNSNITNINGRVFADKINFSGSIFNVNGSDSDWELLGEYSPEDEPKEITVSADVPKYVSANVTKTIHISANGDTEDLVYSADFNGESLEVDENGVFDILTPAESGEYVLTVSASEQGGISDTKSYTVTVDANAPVIRLDADKDKANLGDPAIQIMVSVTDDYGVDTVNVYVDGELHSIGTNDVIEIPTKAVGKHIIRAEASDLAGNVTVSEKIVEILDCVADKEPPIINVSFDKEIYQIGDDLIMTVEAADNDCISDVTVKFDNVEVSGNDGIYSIASLTEGEHEISISAVDASGNSSSAVYRIALNALIDTTAPVVKILSVSPSLIHKGDTIQIYVSVEDESGIAGITASINGHTAEVVDGIITYVVDEEGEYIVIVYAEDNCGNASSASSMLKVNSVETGDTTAPTMRFAISSDDNAVYVGVPVTITVSAEDDSGVVYTGVRIDGAEIVGSDGVYRYVPGTAGDHSVLIYAYDDSDNKTEYEYILTVYDAVNGKDTTAPVIEIGSVPDMIPVGQPIVFDISAEDDSGNVNLTAFINGKETAIVDNTISFIPDKTGEYEIRIIASDNSRNESVCQKTITVTEQIGNDVTAPELDIISFPVQGTVGEEIKIEYTASDDSGEVFIKVTVNGEKIDADENCAIFVPCETGRYDIVITASDAAGNIRTASGSVVVTSAVINDDTLPTMSITGINQIITLGETLIISITAEDDSGNVTVTASINDSPVEIVDGKLEFTPSETGIYTLVIRAEDAAENYVQKLVEILVKEPVEYVDGKPVVNIYINDGSGVSAVGEALDIRVTADDPDGISSIKVTINGEEKELDEEGKLSFIPEETGRYVVTVEAIDSLGNAITETVKQMVVDPEDNSYCEVKITSPSDGGVVTSLTDIKGTVSGDGLVYYSLSYCPAGEEEYIEFASGEETVSNGILGKFDPTLLENGYYNIRLTAYSSLYNVSDEVVVSVEGQMKIGNYSIAFQDMDIPVAGYPLTVIRSYDSRRKSSDGDFGYGWDMALSSIKLSESCIPGSNWYHEASASMFATMYSFAERKVHEISIDYGNGKTEKFRMKLSPNQPNMYKITTGISVSYEATDGSKSKLEPIGTRTNLVYNGNLLCYSSDLTVYNPSKYKLTRADGTVYIISDTNGVESITDTNGNTITITSSGVTHSDGKSIVFDRDSDGRITKITGPSGKAISYEYDSNGNLSCVTDEAGEKTSFTYDRYHYLTDITDSRGVKVARNEYDDDGRLVATVDANGNRLEFSHDIDGKRDIVTDRLGNSTLYVYDNRGNVISETDALGNTTLSTYDSKGNLKTKTDALGNVTTYNYDSKGNLLSVTNALGNTVTNTYSDKGQLLTISSMGVTQFIVDYDERGNLTSTEDAMGNKISYEYDSGKVTSISDGIGTYMNMTYDGNGNVISAVNGAGETATFTYDADGNCASKTITRRTASSTETLTEKYSYDVYGNLTKIIYADGSVTNVEYDSVGNMTAAVDEKGRRTEYEYDIFGNLVKIKYCDNTTETFEYDAEGRNTKATDRMGRSVTMTYDAVGNLISKTYPNGSKVTYKYDAKYRLVSVKGANGGTTKYEYDALDRNTAIVDALDNRTEFDYNSASGLLETMTDPMGNTYTYGYDLNGNRTSVTMPDGTSISTAYDARGRITSQTDQHDNTTRYTYDGADRLTSVTDALGGKWKYSYNSVGELVTITDANGNTTKYEYDNGGRVIKTTNAAGDSATVTYDETDNVLTSTDYAGNITTFTYDELDRVISKTVGSDTVTYSYTTDGLLSSVTDRNGVTSYTYDIMNGLTSVTLYDGKTINYTYDDACRLTSVKTLFGTTKYSYDLMDRLVKVVAHDGTATLYEYDANGNRTAVRYANGMIVKYEYDTVNRLVLEKVLDKDANVVVQYSYTLGAAGERTKVVETGADPVSKRTVEYAYDALYRLTSETVTDANGVSVTEYTYDSNSNRLTKTVDGEVTEYSYNELNQLVSETGIRYKYDKNGNLVKKTEGEQTTTYTYDARNKLIRATVQSGQQVNVEEYAYDFAGNRIAKIGEISATYYLVDTNGALSQVLAEYDENGTLTTNYTRADELISQERNGAKSYYLYDGSDSVRMLANEDGEITDTYTFDAFGNLTASTGSTKNDFLYRGEQYDSFTGLYYLRARYMNPATGTFITMDEYAGSVFEPVSLHKYLYANANPVMNSDPTGYLTLTELTTGMAIQAVIGATISAMVSLINFFSTAAPNQKFDWSNFWQSVIMGAIFGAGFGAVGMYAAAVESVAIYTALGFSSLTFAAISAIDAIKYGSKGNVSLAFTSGFFALLGLGGAAGCFAQAHRIQTARNSATTSTANVKENTCVSEGQCFTGDTLVATDKGQIRIDEIKVGDMVWAYNVVTGETELKTVLKVYVHSCDRILHLYTDEGDINTTTNHPFYVVDQGWTAAGDLIAGDIVYNLDGSTSIVLGSELKELDNQILVYNLEVEYFNSYFVGLMSVLVHNYVDPPVKEVTVADNGLKYKSNPKHTLGGQGNRKNAGIEPQNSLELFGKSVASTSKPNQRYTYDKKTGTLHRFFCDQNSKVWHWSGSTNQGNNSLKSADVPSDIKKNFNLKGKGW